MVNIWHQIFWGLVCDPHTVLEAVHDQQTSITHDNSWLYGNGVPTLARSPSQTGFQRTHFSSLPSARGEKKRARVNPCSLFLVELIKMPNYTQPHMQPGQAQLSVWEMYTSGLLCVHTSISGIRDKAVVHDHIKPLAGIVMPLHWCNPSVVCVCVCVHSQAFWLSAYFDVDYFYFFCTMMYITF